MPRELNHLAFLLLTALGCWLTHLIAPDYRPTQVLTLGLGYVSLVLLALTLAIGPIMLWRRRRNPVNIVLRRDAGIWAGITGALHVVYALRFFTLDNLWAFFLQRDAAGYSPRLNLYGISNDVGLLATLLLLLLLALSNDLSLRRLRGKVWKNVQRFNYALIVLVIAHALGYQVFTGKPAPFTYFVLGLAGVVLGLQIVGVWLYRRRRTRVLGRAPAVHD